MAEPVLFAEERKIQIVEFVERHKKATVAQLCEHFGVSGATVRNDLRDLEQRRQILRTHGGAMIRTKTGLELTSTQKQDQAHEAKERIAEAALELIEDGDTIILDTGTTTLEIARLLHRRTSVTVVTNDLAIAAVLESQPGTIIVLMGGVVRKNFHCTVSAGDATAQIMPGLIVDKAFMGVNGLSFSRGATTPDIPTSQTKRLMVGMAASVIVVCDSSKIGRDSFAQFASMNQIDTVITETCRDEARKHLESFGIDVVCAPER